MNSSSYKPVGVIGSGLGGLAAACTLAARGHRTIVFEANSWLGGKAAILDTGGFRFDMGPTILTLPSTLERIFTEARRDLQDYLTLVKLEPQWRSFFDDGTNLDLVSDQRAMCTTLDAFAPGTSTSTGYSQFLKLSARLHEISDRYFFHRPVGGLRDMFDAKRSFSPQTLRDVLAMRMGATVGGTIRGLVSDVRVAQMLDHFTQYVGSAPDASPAVLCGIAHMQTSEGIWYPMGGTGAVPKALVRLARELGVEFVTNAQVEQILRVDNMVCGLQLANGDRYDLSAVVSNMDSVRTHRELVGGAEAARFKRRRSYEPACSGVVFYWGLDRRYEHLAHHNFVFSKSHEEEFDHIYRRGEPAPDPTCYVCAPAATDPGVAPQGGEALYVLVHAPYLRPHHDWRQMLPEYRRVVIEKLRRVAGVEDLEERTVCERVLTPSDIHERYRVLNGAIYGLSSHGRFFGAFKPSNRSPDISGLYLAGGAAHPGPGMPMVIMSGWIAADALDQDVKHGVINTPLSVMPEAAGFLAA